jgi:hypothetical protein
MYIIEISPGSCLDFWECREFTKGLTGSSRRDLPGVHEGTYPWPNKFFFSLSLFYERWGGQGRIAENVYYGQESTFYGRFMDVRFCRYLNDGNLSIRLAGLPDFTLKCDQIVSFCKYLNDGNLSIRLAGLPDFTLKCDQI